MAAQAPWFQEPPLWASAQEAHLDQQMLELHREIVEFSELVSPSQEQQQMRTDAVQRFEAIARSLWPSSEVLVFGSFATGLYLPTSDIDVVILNSDNGLDTQNRLRQLARQLESANFAARRTVEVIGRARVPIVKFRERQSGIQFDVRLDSQKELQAVDEIKQSLIEFSAMRPLYLLLKMFLQQKELNEVYHTGGISSYTLFVMLKTFLQVSSFNKDGYGDNLGILLVGFFHFYGRCLNVREYGISCRDGGRFFRKSERGFVDAWKPYLLAAEDPVTPVNDIGKNSFNFPAIQAAFRQALDALVSDRALPALVRVVSPPVAWTHR